MITPRQAAFNRAEARLSELTQQGGVDPHERLNREHLLFHMELDPTSSALLNLLRRYYDNDEAIIQNHVRVEAVPIDTVGGIGVSHYSSNKQSPASKVTGHHDQPDLPGYVPRITGALPDGLVLIIDDPMRSEDPARPMSSLDELFDLLNDGRHQVHDDQTGRTLKTPISPLMICAVNDLQVRNAHEKRKPDWGAIVRRVHAERLPYNIRFFEESQILRDRLEGEMGIRPEQVVPHTLETLGLFGVTTRLSHSTPNNAWVRKELAGVRDVNLDVLQTALGKLTPISTALLLQSTVRPGEGHPHDAETRWVEQANQRQRLDPNLGISPSDTISFKSNEVAELRKPAVLWMLSRIPQKFNYSGYNYMGAFGSGGGAKAEKYGPRQGDFGVSTDALITFLRDHVVNENPEYLTPMGIIKALKEDFQTDDDLADHLDTMDTIEQFAQRQVVADVEEAIRLIQDRFVRHEAVKYLRHVIAETTHGLVAEPYRERVYGQETPGKPNLDFIGRCETLIGQNESFRTTLAGTVGAKQMEGLALSEDTVDQFVFQTNNGAVNLYKLFSDARRRERIGQMMTFYNIWNMVPQRNDPTTTPKPETIDEQDFNGWVSTNRQLIAMGYPPTKLGETLFWAKPHNGYYPPDTKPQPLRVEQVPSTVA
ncbi:MAG: hypothetical protein KC476_04005 [Cyanobacteria bacterium HKST-UBA06]|nr:hypothetical protein [Cyanobacteria bacterium HKST-UBA06]